MTDALADFLRRDARRSFAWGECDCLIRLADWGMHLTGQDAAAPWRGRCSSALGAARILKREGGIVAVVNKAFASLGFLRTERAGRGDIAIVEAREGMTGAIVLAESEEGMALVSMPRFGALRVARARLVGAWTLKKPA